MLARDKKAGNRWIAGLLMQTGSLVQMRYELDGSWQDKNAVFSMQRPIKEQKRNPLREQPIPFCCFAAFFCNRTTACNQQKKQCLYVVG